MGDLAYYCYKFQLTQRAQLNQQVSRSELTQSGKTRLYPGVMARLRLNCTYDIDYDDGERERGIDEKLIKSLEANERPRSQSRGRGIELDSGTDTDTDSHSKLNRGLKDFIESGALATTLTKRSREPEVITTFSMITFSNNLSSFPINPTCTSHSKGKGAYSRIRLTRPIKKPNNTTSSNPNSKPKPSFHALKTVKKNTILSTVNELKFLKNEIAILRIMNHVFINGMIGVGMDEFRVYILLEYVDGLSFRELINNNSSVESYFSNGQVHHSALVFYMSEIFLALEYLSDLHIIHRDIKPENILLDNTGHVKIIDFGLSKRLIQDGVKYTYTQCGTLEYTAPEVVNGRGYGGAVDFWGLGCFVFEVVFGRCVFGYDDSKGNSNKKDKAKISRITPFQVYDQILNSKVTFPSKTLSNNTSIIISKSTKQLILSLLQKDRTKRLGCGVGGMSSLRSHSFFRGVDFEDVLSRQCEPPFLPRAHNPEDDNDGDNSENGGCEDEDRSSEEDDTLPVYMNAGVFDFVNDA